MAVSICPSCGYNLERDLPVKRGEWVIHPEWAVYRGRFVSGLTASQFQLLYAVARSNRFIRRAAVGERISASEMNTENVVSAQKSRMKKMLAGQGITCPIFSQPYHGYRWLDEMETPRRAEPADMPSQAAYLLEKAA